MPATSRLTLTATLTATLAIAVLSAAAADAQTSGTSHPEDLNDSITTSDTAPHALTRPAASAASLPAATETRPTPMVPAQSASVATSLPAATSQDTAAQAAIAPAAAVAATSQSNSPRLIPRNAVDPADKGIVSTYGDSDDALGEGTLLKVRLNESLSTGSTRAGSVFTATLCDDVRRGAQIIFPAGSVLHGRVTEVHGGKRIGGKAALHLEAERLTLPDATEFRIAARVIDTDKFRSTHVTSEGTIVRNDGAKGTLAALTLTAGSSAAAGALLGGVPGALIGAGVGAGIGTAVLLRQDHQEVLSEGSQIVLSLTRPMSLAPLASLASSSSAAVPVASVATPASN